MRTQSVLLASALLLAGGGAAAASHDKGMSGDDGMRCEMKGHEKLDAAERKQMAGKMFDKLDADHDGSISRAEFDKHHESMWAKHNEEPKSEAHEHAEQHQ